MLIITSLGLYQMMGSTFKIVNMFILLVIYAIMTWCRLIYYHNSIPEEYDDDLIPRIFIYFLLFFLSLGIHSRQTEATSRLDFLWKMQANGLFVPIICLKLIILLHCPIMIHDRWEGRDRAFASLQQKIIGKYSTTSRLWSLPCFW